MVSGTLLALLLCCLPAAGIEPQGAVVVDTDMGIDDARGLALLLNSARPRVKAIVTSDGSASPAAGAANIRRLLAYLRVSGIPLGVGRSLSGPPPEWREISESLGFAPLQPAATGQALPAATETLTQALSGSEEKASYICLGPLTNLAELITRQPQLRERIGAVFYAGSEPDAPQPSWNTLRDPAAARQVFASGLRIFAFEIEGDAPPFDQGLSAEVEALGGPAARLVTLLQEDERVRKLLAGRHFGLRDESVILGLLDFSLTKAKTAPERSPATFVRDMRWREVRDAYVQGLRDQAPPAIGPHSAVTLKAFPDGPSGLQPDLKDQAETILSRHGAEEWKAALLASEVHGHLDVWALVGAKMGLRALELLGARPGEVKVMSQAGAQAPLAGLSDGLQAAAGASLGRGAIRVAEESPAAAAMFTLGSRAVRLELKAEVQKSLDDELGALAQRFGPGTPACHREARGPALQRWLNLDRRKIFNILFL